MISILLISGFALVAACSSAAAIAPREWGLAVDTRPWPLDNYGHAVARAEVSRDKLSANHAAAIR